MGTTTAVQLTALAATLGAIPAAAVTAAGTALVEVARAEAATDAPRGMIRGRVRLDAVATTGPDGAVTVTGLPPGLWSMLSGGTAAHELRARSSRTGAMQLTGVGWRTGPLAHPGGRGHGTWARVAAQAPQLRTDTVNDLLADACKGWDRGQ